MQDTITCPACKRRLVLPPGVRDIVAQCPRCQTQFPSHPAQAEPEPAWPVATTVADDAPVAAPQSALPVHAPPEPVPEEVPGKSGGWTAWLVGCIMLAVLRGMFSGCDSGRNQSAAFQGRDLGQLAEGLKREMAKNAKPEDDLDNRFRALKADFERKKAEREFVRLFDTLRPKFQEANGDRLASHFDADRMAEEFIAMNLLPEMVLPAKGDFVLALQGSLPAILEGQSPAMAWDTLEIRSVERPAQNEATVLTRLVNAKGEERTVRWWLIRRLDEWQLYDYDAEDIVTEPRLSVVAGLAAATP
jgi:hypothetical protein